MESVVGIFYLLISIFYAFSVKVYSFDIRPPAELGLHRERHYGNFKYLTYWNLLLQCFFFSICSVASIKHLLSGRSKRLRGRLDAALDYLFATIVLPCSLFVCISFWAIYSVDREMIFPAVYDLFFPHWLNHAVHSLPLFAVLTELWLCPPRRFPSQVKGFLTVAAFCLVYLTWVLFIAATRGHWVYPFLEHLSTVGRCGFIGVLSFIMGLCYLSGYCMHDVRSRMLGTSTLRTQKRS